MPKPKITGAQIITGLEDFVESLRGASFKVDNPTAPAAVHQITAADVRKLRDEDNPDAFDRNTVDSGPDGDPNEFRGMMGTSGRFAINSRWDFGWDVLVQTDKNFSRTYDIGAYDDFVYRSEIYLTGLDDRSRSAPIGGLQQSDFLRPLAWGR